MAHDLRNPIAALMANVNYLELAVPSDDRDALDALADMRRSAEQVLRMIENQVAIARLEATPDGTDRGRRALPLGELASQTIDRSRALFEAAGVTVTFADTSGTAAVSADPQLSALLIENVVANVLQHAPRGRTARLGVSADENTVELRLDDDGMEFGAVEREFTRAGQVAMKSRSDARYSRGLGLYVIALITRAMGGTIDTASPDHLGHLRLSFPRTSPVA